VKTKSGRDAAHIGHDRQYGRATSSGQDTSNTAQGVAYAEGKAIARDASHGQGISIIREIDHFRTASISLATLRRTETIELTGKSKLV